MSNEETSPPPKVVMYTTKTCPYCKQAEALLRKNGYNDIQLIYLDADPQDSTIRDEMIQRTNRRTVPQIFINGEHIGGFDDLRNWLTSRDKTA